MSGPNSLAAQACRGDFWAMLEEALRQCGGNPRSALCRLQNPLTGEFMPSFYELPLHRVVDILAQNGIRMVYLPEKHIDRAAQ